MPTNRRPLRRSLRRRISPEAVASWMACDYRALHRALGLHPGEASPLPDCITGLGVSEEKAAAVSRNTSRCFEKSYAQAIALQRELLAIAGWPDCRHAYEENLADAERGAAYCREMVEHPEFGHRGTGSDPASRRAALERAREEVAYRRGLLEKLAKN
jgi:hypothetical protein